MSSYTWPPTVAATKALVFRGSEADTTNDARLSQFIDAAARVVEDITGPMVNTAVTEWHSGGPDGSRAVIVLRRRPVITIETLTAYIGTVAQAFTLASDPAAASAYSYTLEAETSTVTCRTGGGFVAGWPAGTENIRVTYHAGYLSPPANVHLACIEVVRNLWDMTQQGGRPSFGGAGAEDDIMSPYDGYAVTPRVRELLAPNRRIPGIA